MLVLRLIHSYCEWIEQLVIQSRETSCRKSQSAIHNFCVEVNLKSKLELWYFLGAIFEQGTDEVQTAFKFAMLNHNQNITGRRFELQAYVDVINTADAFKLSRLSEWLILRLIYLYSFKKRFIIYYFSTVCNQFQRGVYSMLGAVSPDSFDTLHSYSNTFQMPFVTPWFPEKVLAPSSGFLDYAISMRPEYHQAIIDTVRYYNWDKIIYLYDSNDGEFYNSHLFISTITFIYAYLCLNEE